MNEELLLAELAALGIDEPHWRLLVLLPLAYVAWADTRVQDRERQMIRTIAEEAGLLDEGGRALLDRWLAEPPTADQLARAGRLLAGLAASGQGRGVEITAGTLQSIRDRAEEVAESAGGVLGVAFTVSGEEREALARISQLLDSRAAPLTEDLPTPETGRFEDLP